MKLLVTMVGATALTAVFAAAAHAQLPIPTFDIVGGVSHYNLSSSGSTPFGSARLDIPLFGLVAEGSVGLMRPNEATGTHTYIIPEAQLQWELFPIIVHPYLGIGGGSFRAISGPDPERNDFTLSASAGVRVAVPIIGIGGRAEVRVRGVGSGFGNGAVELTLGFTL